MLHATAGSQVSQKPDTRHETEKRMRPRRPERYRGFVLTPHSFGVEGPGRGQPRWTVGVFLRTEHQSVDDNKYFRVRGVLLRTRQKAIEESVRFGRWLVDRELLPEVVAAMHEAGGTSLASAPFGQRGGHH